MTKIKLNTVAYIDMVVNDEDGGLITGLVSDNFSMYLYNPSRAEVSGSVTVTVVELGNGLYRINFTPNVIGHWTLMVTNATYFPYGKSEDFDCFTNTEDDIATDVDAVKAKTDNLPADPTSETNATTNKNSVIAEVDANEVKIDSIISSLSSLTVDAIADAVWDEALADHIRNAGTTRTAEVIRALILGNFGWNAATNIFTIYAADGTTVLKTFTISSTGRS